MTIAWEVDDYLDLPQLPPDQPMQGRSQAANDAWYRQFCAHVRRWRSLGFEPEQIFDEVADRRDGAPATVKTWWQRAQKIVAQDERMKPTAVGLSASSAAVPSSLRAVAPTDWMAASRILPRCFVKGDKRMVIDRKGGLVPL